MLPGQVLSPVLDILKTLVTHYGTSVVLCTATQPALEGDTRYLRGLPAAREIVREPQVHFAALRRVVYHVEPHPWTWARAAEAMQAASQCLAVVNARRDALALLDALNDPEALHLSTLLCGAHRRAVLDEVRARLRARDGPPGWCRRRWWKPGSTWISLACWALGPLDHIVPTTTADREGRRPRSNVVVFTAEEIPGDKILQIYRTIASDISQSY